MGNGILSLPDPRPREVLMMIHTYLAQVRPAALSAVVLTKAQDRFRNVSKLKQKLVEKACDDLDGRLRLRCPRVVTVEVCNALVMTLLTHYSINYTGSAILGQGNQS